MESGSLINRFKGTEILMKPGDVLVMKPYVLHVLEDSEEKNSRKAYCCSFLPQAVDSGIQSLDQLRDSDSPGKYFFKSFLPLTEERVSAVQFKMVAERRKVLAGLFHQLWTAAHEQTEKGCALTRCHLLDLLAFLTDQYEKDQTMARIQPDFAVPVSRYQTGLQKTLSYIHDHFEQPLKLEDMALMSGASETYFCRLFKHETGMTFLNYLNGLRIERACVLLRNTSDNASDICYKIGFNDYTHFGRQFRKNTGVSPADFRKQNYHVRQIREL